MLATVEIIVYIKDTKKGTLIWSLKSSLFLRSLESMKRLTDKLDIDVLKPPSLEKKPTNIKDSKPAGKDISTKLTLNNLDRNKLKVIIKIVEITNDKNFFM